MQNPWDVRPRSKVNECTDNTEHSICYSIGRALTYWEMLESVMADLFDALVENEKRVGLAIYSSIKSSSARNTTFASIIPELDETKAETIRIKTLVKRVEKFGARRNEIAHGLLVNLGDSGFQLAPSNTIPHKWDTRKVAKFQYTSEDILYYAEQFRILIQEAYVLVDAYSGLHRAVLLQNNVITPINK